LGIFILISDIEKTLPINIDFIWSVQTYEGNDALIATMRQPALLPITSGEDGVDQSTESAAIPRDAATELA